VPIFKELIFGNIPVEHLHRRISTVMRIIKTAGQFYGFTNFENVVSIILTGDLFENLSH
jgi:hypothetical protein